VTSDASNTGDGVTLGHGFWHGVEATGAVSRTVYLPLVLGVYE
jgi:hypothetical protein